MNITPIDSKLADEIRQKAVESPRRRSHHCFHQQPTSPLQRMLVVMEPESYVAPHRHTKPKKEETILILQGAGAVVTFDLEGNIQKVDGLCPDKGLFGVDIAAGHYHTLLSLEPGTTFFECKAGPYQPTAADDFAPWSPVEGQPEVLGYHQMLVSEVKKALSWD